MNGWVVIQRRQTTLKSMSCRQLLLTQWFAASFQVQEDMGPMNDWDWQWWQAKVLL